MKDIYDKFGGLVMSKKILVAFDDSKNAMRSVEFVSTAFSKDNVVTLFNVLPDTAALCQMNSPELTPYFKSQQQSFCTLEDKKKNIVEEALKMAKEKLLEAGFEKEHIEIKLHVKKDGIARDIVSESKNNYDVIVMGRRGLSGIKEFFFGSVSQKVLHAVKNLSVLIVN